MEMMPNHSIYQSGNDLLSEFVNTEWDGAPASPHPPLLPACPTRECAGHYDGTVDTDFCVEIKTL